MLLAGSVMGLSLQISAIYAQPVRSLYSKNQVPKGIEVFQAAALTAASAGQMDNDAVYPDAGGPAALEQAAPQPDLVIDSGAAALRLEAPGDEAAVRFSVRSETTEGGETAALPAPAAGASSEAESVSADPAGPADPDDAAPESDRPAASGDSPSPEQTEPVDETEPSETESDTPSVPDVQTGGGAEASGDGPPVTSALALTNPSALLTETRAIETEVETQAAEPAAPAYARAAITDVSEDTMALYMGIMATECGSAWDYEGCLMIAQVIVNRVHSGYWGDLYQVLTAPNQFSTYSSGVWATRQPTEAQRQAAVDALAGKTVIDEDILFFCTDGAYQRSAYFQSLDHRATYANTMFFAK